MAPDHGMTHSAEAVQQSRHGTCVTSPESGASQDRAEGLVSLELHEQISNNHVSVPLGGGRETTFDIVEEAAGLAANIARWTVIIMRQPVVDVRHSTTTGATNDKHPDHQQLWDSEYAPEGRLRTVSASNDAASASAQTGSSELHSCNEHVNNLPGAANPLTPSHPVSQKNKSRPPGSNGASTRSLHRLSPNIAYQSFDPSGRLIANFDHAGNILDTNGTITPDLLLVQSIQNPIARNRTKFVDDPALATTVPVSELTPGKMIRYHELDYLVIACPATTTDAVPVSLGVGFTPNPTPYRYLITLAAKYAEHIGMPDSHRYILASLPAGYVCASKFRKDSGTARQWLFGSASGTFGSPKAFWPHFLRLVEEGHVEGCECGMCRRMREREVNGRERERRRFRARFEKEHGICG